MFDSIITTRLHKHNALYFAYEYRTPYTRDFFIAYMIRLTEKRREKNDQFNCNKNA